MSLSSIMRFIKPTVWLIFILSGASALIYEVIWMRQLTLVFGSTVFATSTVLTAFMAGLALGSYYFGRKIDESRYVSTETLCNSGSRYRRFLYYLAALAKRTYGYLCAYLPTYHDRVLYTFTDKICLNLWHPVSSFNTDGWHFTRSDKVFCQDGWSSWVRTSEFYMH